MNWGSSLDMMVCNGGSEEEPEQTGYFIYVFRVIELNLHLLGCATAAQTRMTKTSPDR